MAHTVYACPNCDADLQAVLTRRSAQSFRPKETIICRDCLAEFPWQDAVIRKSATMLRGLGGVGSSASGFTNAPTPLLVGQGSFYDEAGVASLTIPNITVGAGQVLLACYTCYDNTDVLPLPSATWNGVAATSSQAADSGIKTGAGFKTWVVSSTATGSVVFTINSADITSLVVLLYVVNGTGVSAVVSVGSGTSTTPNTSVDGTPTAGSVWFGVTGTQGPQADDAGTWTDDLIALDRLGTSGASATQNSTVSVAYKFALGGAENVGKTGITSRVWVVRGREVTRA